MAKFFFFVLLCFVTSLIHRNNEKAAVAAEECRGMLTPKILTNYNGKLTFTSIIEPVMSSSSNPKGRT